MEPVYETWPLADHRLVAHFDGGRPGHLVGCQETCRQKGIHRLSHEAGLGDISEGELGKSGTTTIGPKAVRRVVAPGIAREIGAAMRQAVAGDIGRIYTNGADVRGLAVAGKSGTAQLDPGRSPHSWFIGFAPYDDPQIAIAVLVENSGGGGVRASPIAGEILRAWRDWSRG